MDHLSWSASWIHSLLFEVVNERFLVEEIYERQLLQAEEYERDKEAREPVSCTLQASLAYGAIPTTNDS